MNKPLSWPDMSAPRVSILVPVYNVESYLRQALDSILAQTFDDFELLLINDGSSDSSGKIIEEYRRRDSRIVAVHKENEGVSRTLNLGLSMARGEFIRRFDSDDTCLPNALEHQVRFLERHPEVALVGTQIAFQSDRGKLACNFRNPKNNFFSEGEYRLALAEDFYNGCPVIHATVLMRRCIVEMIGGYRVDFLTSEDVDLWLRIVERYPIAVLNECSYFVRLHSTSATRQHAASTRFYRELALAYHEERLRKGTDPLQRGESMPKPGMNEPTAIPAGQQFAAGTVYRDDLDFIYRLMVDARDWSHVRRLAGQILSSGWRRRLTYKLLIYPWLGKRLVQTGVRIKSVLRRRCLR